MDIGKKGGKKTRNMKEHHPFEFVLNDDSFVFAGRYLEEVTDMMATAGYKEEDGTWKWYGNLIGDAWRFNPNRNEITRRIGQGRGHRHHTSVYSLKLNIEKAHEARRNNPELARRIASVAGKASWDSLTAEQKRKRIEKMLEAKREKYGERE